MSKAGKAAEPSMEEILSSIRKIIAEEPVGAAASAPPKAAVDDVLEMADAAPAAEPASRADAETSPSPVPSWLFPATKVVDAASPDSASNEPAPKPKSATEAPKPFFRAAEAAPIPAPVPAAAMAAPAARIGTNGIHPKSASDAKPSEDLGAFVPRRSPEPTVPTSSGVTERRTPQAGLPEWLSRASGAAAKVAPAPQPIAAPVEPTRVVPREPEPVKPALSELAKPITDVVAPAAAAVAPAATAAEPKPMAGAREPEAIAIAPAATMATAAPEEPVPVVDPVAATETAGSAVAVTEAAPHSAVPKPTLLSERPRSPKGTPAADVVPTVVASGGVRTLDDTIIDLLRPMIRQWLDDNMPRMVERALRVELAAGVKSKSDPSKH